MSNPEDIDLNHLAKLFDAALASDNETVKRTLRNFMLVASIVEAEEVTTATPFGDLLRRVEALEKNQEYLKGWLDRATGTSTTYGKNCFTDLYGSTGKTSNTGHGVWWTCRD